LFLFFKGDNSSSKSSVPFSFRVNLASEFDEGRARGEKRIVITSYLLARIYIFVFGLQEFVLKTKKPY
jgi:hypothetical protein